MARNKHTAQKSYTPTAKGSGASRAARGLSIADRAHADALCLSLRSSMDNTQTWASLEKQLRRSDIHSTTATSTEVKTTTISTRTTTKTTTTVTTTTVVPIKPAARPRQIAVVQIPTSDVFSIPEMTEPILNSGISQKQLFE
nr:hypothetical protein B0A51_05856 [Rachicladosporium sp. CCFEE 5018]